jgi:hypothetical protein
MAKRTMSVYNSEVTHTLNIVLIILSHPMCCQAGALLTETESLQA